MSVLYRPSSGSNVRYYYARNAQGDIRGLVNSSGTLVVRYAYDSWGKPVVQTDSTSSGIGTLNPFRYRGYIYDTVTGTPFESLTIKCQTKKQAQDLLFCLEPMRGFSAKAFVLLVLRTAHYLGYATRAGKPSTGRFSFSAFRIPHNKMPNKKAGTRPAFLFGANAGILR